MTRLLLAATAAPCIATWLAAATAASQPSAGVLPARAPAIAARAERALLAAGRHVLLLEATPRKLIRVASLDTGAQVEDLAWLSDTTAVVVGAAQLTVISANASRFERLAVLPTCEGGPGIRCLQIISAVAVAGELGIIGGALHTASNSHYTAGIAIVDLSRPETPRMRGVTEVMSNSRWFSPPWAIELEPPAAYVGVVPATYNTLQVVDIADSDSPSALQRNFDGLGLGEATVSGDVLYTADRETPGGVVLWDVEEPLEPQLIASERLQSGTFVHSLASSHSELFTLSLDVSAASVISRFDVTDPLHPELTGSIRVPLEGTGGQLATAEEYVWLSTADMVTLFLSSPGRLVTMDGIRFRRLMLPSLGNGTR
jgi:hypothetical protein